MKEEIEEQQHPPALATGEENPPPPPSTAIAVTAADPPPLPQLDGYAVSLNIWPPSQRTRDAVVNRLVETLSSPSVLSKRYGTLPHDEASAAARRIEEEAFSASSAAADGGAIAAPRDDAVAFGIEILQIYSKEISRRMMESAKSRVPVAPASPAPDSDLTVEMALQATPVAAVTDEAESVETEAVSY